MCEDCENLQPCCDNGKCDAPENARYITNCIHCGGELREVNGYWYHHSQFFDDGTLISSGMPQDIVSQKHL